jgi:hypothetical protein
LAEGFPRGEKDLRKSEVGAEAGFIETGKTDGN